MKKFFFVLALAAAAAAGYFYYTEYYIPELKKSSRAINSEIEKILVEDILLDPVLIVDIRRGKKFECTARMPLRFTPRDIERIFKKYALSKKGLNVNVKKIRIGSSRGALVIFKIKNRAIAKLRLARNTRPKIAVILDDWGYNKKSHRFVSAIKQPFTMAVLPNLPYSKKAAALGKKYKKEIILHLPMEPSRNLPLEKNTIKMSMPFDTIRYITRRHIEALPGAAGVNNHQGSLVTGDREVMKVILEVIAAENMFFIDSWTNRESVAYETAKKAGIPSNRRNIFVDNIKDMNYNRLQLDKLKKLAKSRGYAIGIGHDNPVTLKALEKNMPKIESEGFEFVYAAEVAF